MTGELRSFRALTVRPGNGNAQPCPNVAYVGRYSCPP